MIAIPLIPALDNPITKAAKKLRIHEVVLISEITDKNIGWGQKRSTKVFRFHKHIKKVRRKTDDRTQMNEDRGRILQETSTENPSNVNAAISKTAKLIYSKGKYVLRIDTLAFVQQSK